MGRYANFNTGFEYKFWFGVQPSEDIQKFGGASWDDYDEQSNTMTYEWTKEDIPLIQKKLEYMKEKYKYNHDDISSFLLTPEGTKKLLQHNIHSNFNDSEKKLAKYYLGCVIYHQLLYTDNLTVHYEVY